MKMMEKILIFVCAYIVTYLCIEILIRKRKFDTKLVSQILITGVIIAACIFIGHWLFPGGFFTTLFSRAS